MKNILTNSSPLKKRQNSKNERIGFQPSIFRCCVCFRESMSVFFSTDVARTHNQATCTYSETTTTRRLTHRSVLSRFKCQFQLGFHLPNEGSVGHLPSLHEVSAICSTLENTGNLSISVIAWELKKINFMESAVAYVFDVWTQYRIYLYR